MTRQLPSTPSVRKRIVLLLRSRLRRETALRKAAEKELSVEKQHCRTLRLESERMREQSRTLAHQVLVAQEEERKTISRELHDEIAQLLAGVNVQLAALSESALIDTFSLQKRIAQTRRLVTESVDVVHRFARELRPALLDDLGLIPALRSYIRSLPARKGLRIRFVAFPGVEELSNRRRTVLYRVAQEALTNALRHARATRITVRIQKAAGGAILDVHDNGKSFRVGGAIAATPRRRLGIVGMRERVEMEQGVFEIKSTPATGTRVRAKLPV